MPFRFRRFEVEDDLSTMRVGTDAMILGSWTDPGGCGRILDIGTGCGVLALMMAQRSEAEVTAVEIDPASAAQAAVNFARSPWSGRMEALHTSLQEYTNTHPARFDLIISNPPFFTRSLKSPALTRNRARHDDTLGTEELLSSVCRLLGQDGRFCLILPADRCNGFLAEAKSYGMYLQRRLTIRSKPGYPPVRCALELGFRSKEEPEGEEIVIRDAGNGYSLEYLQLTGEFHHFN